MPDIICQRRFGVRTSFCFGEDSLTYGVGDWSSFKTQVIPYEILDLSSRGEYSISNTGYVLRWCPLLAVAVIFCQLGAAYLIGKVLLAGLLLAGFMAAALIFEWTEVRFVEFGTLGTDADGVRRFLRVIETKGHEKIVDELERKWRDRMRRLYADVNLAGDLEQEANRHAWLHGLGVIDDDELARTMTRLRAAAQPQPTAPGPRLH